MNSPELETAYGFFIGVHDLGTVEVGNFYYLIPKGDWNEFFRLNLVQSGRLPIGYAYKCHTTIDKSWNGMLPVKVESSYEAFRFGFVDDKKNFFHCKVIIGFVQLFELDSRSPSLNVWDKTFSHLTSVDISSVFASDANFPSNPIVLMKKLCFLINALNHCVGLTGNLGQNVNSSIINLPPKPIDFKSIGGYINCLKFEFYGASESYKNRDGELITNYYSLVVVENISNNLYLQELLKSAISTFFKPCLLDSHTDVFIYRDKLAARLRDYLPFEEFFEKIPHKLRECDGPVQNLMSYKRRKLITDCWVEKRIKNELALSVAYKYDYAKHCASVLSRN